MSISVDSPELDEAIKQINQVCGDASESIYKANRIGHKIETLIYWGERYANRVMKWFSSHRRLLGWLAAFTWLTFILACWSVVGLFVVTLISLL